MRTGTGRLLLATAMLAGGAVAWGQGAAPAYQVVPLWPKPLPNHWILGSITGVATDAQDHIWLVHRGLESLTGRTEAGTGTTPQTAEVCCAPAPPVLEFDAAGNLLTHWGRAGEGFDWPVSPGGLAVDAKGIVWIAAAGPPDPVPSAAEEPANAMGPTRATAASAPARGRGAAPATPARPIDAHVLAFTRAGKFVRQIGKPGTGASGDPAALDRPADVAVDSTANEVFVADGGAHQRIVVFDAATGTYKRQWSGHGQPFARLSCVTLSKDRRVYVCDRRNNRIQVFRTDGTFVSEAIVSGTTKGLGSVWDVALSPDAGERLLYVADGQDQRVFVLDRATLQPVTSFGGGGRWPGGFYALGRLAFDSKGSLYTGEMYEGKRLQKFVRR